MNDNNNSENNQNTNINNYVDPRNVNAEVIGELRKDKIGKPILVIEMAILFAVILIALPIVNNMLNDDTSFLYKLVYGSTMNTPIIDIPVEKEEFLDGSVEQPLTSATVMKFSNIVMQNFDLSGSNVNCKIYSYNGVLNLDEEPYYLEIYSSSSNLIAAVKLTGTYDNQAKQVELTANGLSFNEDYSYVGKIVKMEDNLYPAITLSTDESGIGSFICRKGNRELEYTFKNNYLIKIRDYYKVELGNQSNSTAYLNLKRTYDEKAANLGSSAVVEEVADGFTFNASIDLETMIISSTVVDYEYYKLDTEAKIIHYALEGKGFDCE